MGMCMHIYGLVQFFVLLHYLKIEIKTFLKNKQNENNDLNQLVKQLANNVFIIVVVPHILFLSNFTGPNHEHVTVMLCSYSNDAVTQHLQCHYRQYAHKECTSI